MSRTVTTFATTVLLEAGDRVRYVDFPKDRRGVSRVNRQRERVGTVVEVHPAVYDPPARPGGLSWLRERDLAVVEFDDGTSDTIEDATFLLQISMEPYAVLRQLVVLS